MGLRTLIKGLRSSDKKQTPSSPSPSTSTVEADKNDSIITVQPVVYSSGVNVKSEENKTPRDLWDEAYAILSRDDPSLKQRYEDIILSEEGGNGESSQNHLGWSPCTLP